MNIQEPASLVQYIINLFLFIFRECIDGVGLDALKKAYQIIDDHPENKAEVRKNTLSNIQIQFLQISWFLMINNKLVFILYFSLMC